MLFHPFWLHWTNFSRSLLEVTSQIVWHIHAIAFKAAWRVMQTLAVTCPRIPSHAETYHVFLINFLWSKFSSSDNFHSLELLNVPQFLFRRAVGLKTTPRGNFSHSLADTWCEPHPPINKLPINTLEKCQPAVAERRALNIGNGSTTRWDRLFLTPFMPKWTEVALPVPSRSFQQTSPDTAMLFAPFRPTSPYPALTAEAEPISKRHCWKWHHEAESLMTYNALWALKS